MASVLENRDRQVLWKRLPKTGIRSFTESMTSRPRSVRLYRFSRNRKRNAAATNTYHHFLNMSEMPISTLVGSGSVPPSWL